MKKLISLAVSALMLSSSVISMNTLATGEDIYCNIHSIHTPITVMGENIDENCVRIDVIFDNFDKGISTLGMHIQLGEGLKPIISDFTNDQYVQSILMESTI